MNNDLISRSALKAELMKRAVSCPKSHIRAYGSCISALEVSPAVDAEPVRHGKWLYVGYGKPDAWDCSECSVMVAKQHFYCPRCGAKMDGGVSSR